MNELLTSIYILLTPPREVLDFCRQDDFVQRRWCEESAKLIYAEQEYISLYVKHKDTLKKNKKLRKTIRRLKRARHKKEN